MSPAIKDEDLTLLKLILEFAKNKKIKLYIVGGYLRDLLLGRQKTNPDIDFCLQRGSLAFGRALAKKLKCGFVVLDDENGTCRLVKKIKDKIYTFDFTDFRGKTLEEDLLCRDFTMNSLCVDLEYFVKGAALEECLLDLYGARKDIKAKLVRVVDPGAFDDDPLRILRAFSLSCIFGFSIDKATLKLIKAKKGLLSTVSWERIRDELFKVLGEEDSFECIQMMDELKILKLVIPELELMRNVEQGPYHHLDVLKHSMETLRQLEKLIKEFKRNKEVQGYLFENFSGERNRLALMKLAALLHDIGKPKARRRQGGKTKFYGHERVGSYLTDTIARRLKLSNDEVSVLRKLVFWHLRPGYLGDTPKPTPRAKFRYFRDAAAEGASILLLSLADQRSTKGPLTSLQDAQQHEKVCASLIKEYFLKKNEIVVSRLVTGDDLIKEFKLTPSPLIGKILCELEELQAIGKIKTKKDALLAAKKLIK